MLFLLLIYAFVLVSYFVYRLPEQTKKQSSLKAVSVVVFFSLQI